MLQAEYKAKDNGTTQYIDTCSRDPKNYSKQNLEKEDGKKERRNARNKERKNDKLTLK